MLNVPPLSPMRNPVRDYDWGSVSALAELQSRIPSGGPEAELWMGAHPAAPSSLVVPGATVVPLPDAIADDPAAILGDDAVTRFGARLPFILKILAIAKPLSLQVHPDADRAQEQYRPDGGPYVDAFHKPEMLYALQPTEALFGFRPAAQVVALLEHLSIERLAELTAALAKDDGTSESARLKRAFATLLEWPAGDRTSLVAEVATGVRQLQDAGNTDYPEVFEWAGRLVGLHPADPMVLAPLLLDLVKLNPGDFVFVPAGVPHCYLSGLGVEILAASDNVLRSGLTSKAVDIEELLQVVDTRPLAAAKAIAADVSPHETVWRMPVDDFGLRRVRLPAGATITGDTSVTGPQILLGTAGRVRVSTSGTAVELTPGMSAFATALAGPIEFTNPGTGPAEVFRASIG